MATHGQYHYYGKITLSALIVGCVTGALLFIISIMIELSTNGTTSGKSLSLADSLLYSLSGLGILILIVETIYIMVCDWHGAMTLRFAATTEWRYRGKRVRVKYWFFPLYVVFPYIMLPIYLIRTVMDQRQAARHNKVILRERTRS